MELVALPALTDNYIWMLHDGYQALVVDPGQDTPVHDALNRLGLRLTAILVTHHHGDHVAGLAALLPRLEGDLWGPPGACPPLDIRPPSQKLIWNGLVIQVLPVPGHTLDHLAYFLPDVPLADSRSPVLFCGDTLFSAGCGRLFEGTAAQMLDSLDRLGALPGQTQVCCTHEYTLSNLKFAAEVEPGNVPLQMHRQHCEQLRARGLPTLPTDLTREHQINPFLRCDAPDVVASAQAQGASATDRLSVFTTLRLWKNRYR